MNATIEADGSLKLTASNEDRARIKELETRGVHDPVAILADLLESYFTNGGFEPFDAGQGNPFVGLTSAPCIAESMTTHDDGENEIIGRFWYFGAYMLRDPVEDLKRRGRVVFDLA